MGQVLVDDLDKTIHDPANGVEVLTWSFSFGPDNALKRYSIDLTRENYSKLEAALAPFVEVATPDSTGPSQTSRAPKRGSRAANSSTPSRSAQVREWAAAEGLDVSARGRISADVLAKYDQAHQSNG